MASLGELSVLIGAEVNEAGFTRAVNAIGGLETAAKSAAAAAGKTGGSLGNLSDVAGKASASINSGLVSSFAAFDKAVKPIDASLGRIGRGLQDVGGGLTTYITLPLAGLATAAIIAAAKVDSLTRGLQAVTQQQLSEQGVTGVELLSQSAAETTRRLQELREVAKLPGLGFSEAIQGSIRLQAVGLSADRAKAVLLAFGNAIATTGGGKSELDRVTVQLGQLSAKGKVLAQDLRPIIEAAPAAASALRKLYGTVDSETISKALAEQGKSSSDFIDTLTTELGKLPKVTGGLAIAGENLSDSLTLAGSSVGLVADKLFDLSGVANAVGGFIERLAGGFASLSPETQKLVFSLGAAAAAAGPIVFAIGTVVVALAEFKKALLVLELSTGAVFTPLLLGAAAVAIVVYEIIDHWDDLVSYFGQSGEGGRIFSDLVDSVTNAVAQISDAFAALNGGGDFGDLVSATGILKAAFRDVAVGITAVANVIGGTVGAIVALVNGNLTEAFEQASRALLGLVQPIANAVGFQLRLGEASEAVKKGFEGAAFGGGIFGDELLHLSGILPGFNSQLQGFAGGLPSYATASAKYAGILEGLREKLEKLQAQRERETTVGAIKVDTGEIERVQKQIDDLVGKAGAGSDAIAKAFESLQKALRAAEGESIALGSSFDYINARRGALESGIKNLIAAGLSPTSAAIKALVKDLQSLPVAVDQLVARAAKGTQVITPEFELKLPKLESVPDLVSFVVEDPVLPDYAKIFGDAANAVLAGSNQLSQAQKDASQVAQDINTGLEEVLVGGLNSMAVGVGEAIGNIALGFGGLNDIGAAILGPIGDIAIQLGKLAIGAGLAIAGINASLKSLNPVLAIGAGIALVALGTAVKGAASSIATGSAGASLSSQPASSQNNAAASSMQKLQIQVVGELRGRGADLVAVLKVADYRSLRTN